MVLFISIFGAVLVFLISRLLTELNNLATMIPVWDQWLTNNNAQDWFAKIKSYYVSLHVPDYVLKFIQDSINGILKISKNLVTGTLNWFVDFLTTLPYIFMVSIVVLMATFFLSKDKESMQSNAIARLKPDNQRKAKVILNDLNTALSGFLRAEILIMSLTGLQTAFGLMLLGVDYALTLGVITAFAEFMPILGTASIFLPWIIAELIMGKFRFAIALTILFFIGVIVRQIVEPKLLSHGIGIQPLGALVSLFVGLKIFGGWGIIIGPTTLVIYNTLRKANTE
jgi:sporulation integral membrane protein YtvI